VLRVIAVVAVVLAVSLAVDGQGDRRQQPPGAPAVTPVHRPRAAVGRRAAGTNQRLRDLARRMPYVSVAGRARREVALTFDDGPGPYTPAVVDALRGLHAAATFFQVGTMLKDFPGAALAQAGDPRFAFGDHTDTHAVMRHMPRRLQARQIDDEAHIARHEDLPSPVLFRAPYGLFDRVTLGLLHQRRMLMVLWTIDSRDYLQPGADTIVRNVLSRARPGAIILMHDAGIVRGSV
jgi:peptidoglycan/xylan/chitin deacetylase (PgdA/CDA1 family)